MRSFAVSVIGRDRPGIVSDVTRVLLDHDMNIQDAQATVLRGHFTLTLIATADPGTSELEVLSDLEGVREDLGLEAAVIRQIEALADDAEDEATHVVTVFGLDRPGLIHAISAALADSEVSIRDLNSRVIPPDESGDPTRDDEPVYGMMIEVAVPEGGAAGEIARALDTLAAAAGIEVTLRPLDEGE